MTTDQRIENQERDLPSGNRRKRWLLAAVGLGILAVIWPLAASVSGAEVATSAQEQQPASDWTMLELLGIIAILVPGGCLLLRWRRRSRLHRLKATINLKCPICGEVMSAPIVPPPLLHDGVKVGQTAACQSCGNVSLVGIKNLGEGWLFFPTAGLILSPLANIVYLVLAVTNHGLGGLFGYLMLLHSSFVIFQIWVAVVFLMVKTYAPKLVVGLLLANVALALITRVAVGTYLDQDPGRYLENAVVLAAVWIPYFLLSRRVKATFGREGVAWPIQQEGVIVSQESGLATTPPKVETQAGEGNRK